MLDVASKATRAFSAYDCEVQAASFNWEILSSRFFYFRPFHECIRYEYDIRGTTQTSPLLLYFVCLVPGMYVVYNNKIIIKGPYKRSKTKPKTNEQTFRRVFGENENGVQTQDTRDTQTIK